MRSASPPAVSHWPCVLSRFSLSTPSLDFVHLAKTADGWLEPIDDGEKLVWSIARRQTRYSINALEPRVCVFGYRQNRMTDENPLLHKLRPERLPWLACSVSATNGQSLAQMFFCMGRVGGTL